MIIRPLGSTRQLITQPAHAAMAARIMQHWQADQLPGSPRKASILHAVEEHDNGWAEVDASLVLDETTGRLLDFIELPDELKRETSLRGIERLSSDPYAAALVAQHRLHVYRRYAEHPEWRAFFAQVTAARDASLTAAGDAPLDELIRDYRFVRAGDLASLAFCNNGPDVTPGECGYAMRLVGTTLFVAPDPFAGRTIEIDVAAREIGDEPFASAADARLAVTSAPIVRLTGLVKGEDVDRSLRFVGVVRSPLRVREEAPRQGDEGGAAAWLEIDERFAGAIQGMAANDAILVLTWLHHAHRDVLEVHPRGDRNRPLTGVFATRSPDRPNPIGLHRVTVLEIVGNRIKVHPLEAIDGTPVIDIKPVLPQTAER